MVCRSTGGTRQDDPRRQPGGRGDVPAGHRAPPGERRGVLAGRRRPPSGAPCVLLPIRKELYHIEACKWLSHMYARGGYIMITHNILKFKYLVYIDSEH